MGTSRKDQLKALQGSLKAVTALGGRGKPKIGQEEFMAVAERFGLSKNTLAKIRQAVAEEEWGEGPFLGNYYSGLKTTKVEQYERTARRIFGVNYALGVSSGTGALHCACVAAGVGPGCEVVCPAIGFVATPAAVVLAKGVPVFCDVDESLCMDPSRLEALITPRTVAITPTHVMGGVCDMRPIMKIARKHGLKVIEDAAQSCGATYRGKRAGAIGDIGCFSIAAYKIVGAGEGGLLLTNNKRMWERANQLAEGGGLWRPERFAPPRYDGELFCGANYRMTELEAAMDNVQLRRMPATVRRFNRAKLAILKRLKTFREITPQKLNDPEGDAGYAIRFFPETIDLSEKITASLKDLGVNCNTRGKNAGPDWHLYSHMYPVTLQRSPIGKECVYECPYYTARGGRVSYSKNCPIADDLFNRVVNINLNQWFSPQDCRHLADAINTVLGKLCTRDDTARGWF